jgi:hypothetical protein
VLSKYRGPLGSPPGIPFLPVDDCHCWHGAWQDFSATSRFNVVTFRNGFALTPSISIGLPSHDYDFQGEAVAGRHLKELRLGVDVGQRLDAISPRLSVSAHYSYAIVEKVLDLPNNRSHTAIEGAFAASRQLSVAGVALWQHTHGGLRYPIDVLGFDGRPEQHDRLLRDNSMHVGGRVSYAFRRFKVDLFGSYIAFVNGTNTHAGRAVTVGITRWFGL